MKLRNRLAELQLFSWPAFLIMLAWVLGVGAGFYSIVYGGPVWLWLALFFSAHVVASAWLIIAQSFISLLARGSNASITIGAFLLGGLIETGITTIFANAIAVNPPGVSLIEKFLLGLLSYSVWYLAIAVMVQEEQHFREAQSKLREQVANEESLEETAKNQLDAYRYRVALAVQQTLEDSLKMDDGETSNQLMAEKLQEVLKLVVKPMSAKLAERSEFYSQMVSRTQGQTELPLGQRMLLAIRSLAQGKPLSPLAVSLLILFTQLGPAVRLRGFATASILAVASLVFIYSCLWLAKRLRPKANLSNFVFISIAHASGSFIISGENFGNIGLLFLLITVDLLTFLLFALAAQMYENRVDALVQLEKVVERIKWSQVKLNQISWSEKQRFAVLVHGEIQGRIAATALQLRFANEEADQEQMQKLIADLKAECFNALFAPNETLSPEDLFADVTKLWKASLKVSFHYPEILMQDLRADPAALDALAVIVREAVNNAATHGRARNITFALNEQPIDQPADVPGRINLRIEAQDDGGSTLSSSGASGLGTDLLTRLTTFFKLDIGSDGAKLVAEIPLRMARAT